MISNVVDAISFLNAHLIFEKNTYVLQRILISFTVQLRSRKSENKNKKITQIIKKKCYVKLRCGCDFVC